MGTIIKKIQRGLSIAAITFVLAGTITAATTTYANVKYSSYSTDDQITSIAEVLDCDTSYLTTHNNHYLRMEHNGDEPIYVCIDSGFTKKEKTQIIDSLDYTFGIIGTINSHYRYEIVDEATYKTKLNKTKIYYTLKEADEEFVLDNSSAQINRNKNLLTYLTAKRLMNNFTIKIDRDVIAKSTNPNELFNSSNHELGHALSFDDTYEIDGRNAIHNRNQGNTLMNALTTNELEIFTPNDIKCWIALYSEDEAQAKELVPFLEEYTKNYYQEFTQNCFEKCKKVNDFNLEEFEFESSITHIYLDGTQRSCLYKIKVGNGQYTFTILDKDTNKVLDTCSGIAENINGVVVLKELNLKVGLQPYTEYGIYENGVVQDVL